MTTEGLTDLQTMKSLKLFHVNMYRFLIRGGRGANDVNVSLFAPIKGCTTECGREKKTLQEMGDVKDTDDDVAQVETTYTMSISQLVLHFVKT